MNRIENFLLPKAFLFTSLFTGLIWLRSGFGKIESGDFANLLGGILTKFASQNPYPFYKNFLENVVIPNSQIFGVLTMFGELLVGVSLFFLSIFFLCNHFSKKIGLFYLVGFIGGVFLNLIFWLASGWTSPSTDSLNLLMMAIEITGVVYLLKLINVRSNL